MIKNIYKYIFKILSWLIAIAIIWFLGNQLLVNIDQFQPTAIFRFRPLIASLSVLGFIIAIIWWGIVWYILIPSKERHKVSFIQAIQIHLYAWLARYIPGKVAMLVGKVQASRKFGISKRATLFSTAYEQLLQIASAVIIGTLLVGLAWYEITGSIWGLVIMLTITTISIIRLHPKIFYPLANTILQKLGRQTLDPQLLHTFPKILSITSLYIIGQIINGVSFFLLIKAVYPIMNQSLVYIIGSYSLAGVIGIMAIVVPSGLGVKEGVLTALLSQLAPLPIAIQLSILTRIVSTLIDAIIAIILAINWLAQKHNLYIWLERSLYALGAVFLISLPLVYTGSYIDEYWHIFAGQDIIQTGKLAEIYTSGAYLRGSYASIITGIIQNIIPNSIYALKLIPISISILSWILWFKISQKLIPNNPIFRIIFFLLWISSPWLIVNHTYIRMYVFYELMIALAIWIALQIQNKSNKIWYIVTTLTIIIYTIFAYISFDNGAYLVLLFWLILVAYQFIAKPNLYPKRQYRQLSLLVLTIISLSIPFVQRLITQLFTLDVQYGTDISLIQFFNEQNTIISIFIIIGLIIGLYSQFRIIAIATIAIFSLHLLLPIEAQLIRTIFYLLPSLYFFAALSLSKIIPTQTKPIITIAIIVTLGIIIQQTYPPQYWQGPNIPGEINYIDYKKAYNYVQDNCQNKTILETSPTPYLGQFYGVEVKPVINNIEWLEQDRLFYQEQDQWYVNYNQQALITNTNKIPEKYCWIQRQPSLGNYLKSENIPAPQDIVNLQQIQILIK
jgi:hypothetical protein